MNKKKSWEEKVLQNLQSDDVSKLVLMKKLIIKTYEREIRIREEQITSAKNQRDAKVEEFEEELLELREARNDAFLSVNPERISSVQARKEYLEDFNDQLDEAIHKVLSKKKEKKSYEDSCRDVIDTLQEEIDQFQYKLSNFK